MKKLLLKIPFILIPILLILCMVPLGQASASISNESYMVEQQYNNNQMKLDVTEAVYGLDDREDLYNLEGLIEPYAEIGPKYPGTSVAMRIGDVLYSTKTFGSTTQIVGHVGIVNSNFKVVHVTPAVNGGKVDNFSDYLDRHDPGETIRVYRPRDGRGVEAARWATYNYTRVTNYFINPVALMGTISPNYCSKFIWQAFYYGEGIDLFGGGNFPHLPGFVTPSNVISSKYLSYQVSFRI
ncbi:hypothetical protein [Paenibacillus massiliensis]|uniref:hypothetical protein n=1 Tax=Paenibacillus massiliensis TaxID=225917 RepID=UPI0003753BDF|nr:hypothetical protein [Paenibacillus massiliensis]